MRATSMMWWAAMGCAVSEPGAETPFDLSGPCDTLGTESAPGACVHVVPDQQTWRALTLPGSASDVVRATKYLVPVDPMAELPALVMNVQVHLLHVELLTRTFGDLYPGLTPGEYLRASLYPDGRVWWSGSLTEHVTPEGDVVFAFTVWDDPADPTSTVSEADALAVADALGPRFKLGPLAFAPSSAAQIAAATAWTRGLPVYDPTGAVDFEAYTPGTAYGTVRRVDLASLSRLEAEAAIGVQDILVLDGVPADVERPVSATITGSRQADLSHLNVRSAARGTPNCFVRDAWNAFEPWEGQLVALTCDRSGWSTRPASASEAEAWWASLRPEPIGLRPPVLDEASLPQLHELPLDDAARRRDAIDRFGSKGTQLAMLYRLVPEDLQLDGFLVPFSAYADHLGSTTWRVDLGEGPREVSLADTVDAWLDDPDFLQDGTLRRERLAALRAAILDAPTDPDLILRVAERVREVWGTHDVSVRLRSSSNAEDALEFSGAGLYESERACAADDLDGDDAGPSRCDPSDEEERTLSAALKKVWASTWGTAAYEERDWFGMDHRAVAMGVLVNDRSRGERLNAVAFSGVPTAPGDDRVLINSQLGDLEVVSSTPGVAPERVLVDTSSSPWVVARVTASTIVPPGQHVADEATVLRIAEVLTGLERDFPVDDVVPAGTTVLLDTEWKILSDGRLIVKQIRPFLRRELAR